MKTRKQINDRFKELQSLMSTNDEMLANGEITSKEYKMYQVILNQQMNGWRRSAMAYIAKITGQHISFVYWKLKGRQNNLLYLDYIVIY